MMIIYLNGQQQTLAKNTSLLQALTDWQYSPSSFAIAINESFVPSSQYQHTVIQPNDRIEIVSPMQGG